METYRIMIKDTGFDVKPQIQILTLILSRWISWDKLGSTSQTNAGSFISLWSAPVCTDTVKYNTEYNILQVFKKMEID